MDSRLISSPLKKLALASAISLTCSATASADELDVLKALKDSTVNDEGISSLTTWGSGAYCDWEGIICTDGKVTTVDLANSGLQGVLPDNLGELPELEVLILSGNDISGTLPDSLGDLTKLKKLMLDGNAFDGTVPDSLAGLEELALLNLDYNRLYDSADVEVSTFLDSKHLAGENWSVTQTIAPADVEATARTIDSITLEWTPIEYVKDGGFYEVFVSTDADFSEEENVSKTDNKSDSSITISRLDASRRYYFAVRTRTEKAGASTRELLSGLSNTVTEFTLRDTDGDSIPDIEDDDADNDGLTAEQETRTADTDADGLPDHVESNIVDTDADGQYDFEDADDDNDGRATLSELGERPDNPQDSDVDGIPDYLDVDSRNAANTADGSGDSDSDGLSDKTECPNAPLCVDSDGDGIANYMDRDDDNDGLQTVEEGTTLDSDGDGLIDALEPNNLDLDSDGNRNHEDNDDDGDGILTSTELNGQTLEAPDLDNDNIADYLDLDSTNIAGTEDGSGDSDNDGVSDSEECPAAPNCVDANANGIPSYLDDTEIVSRKQEDAAMLGDAAVLGNSDEKTDSSGGGASHPLMLLAGLLIAGVRRRFNR